ncbi:MAG: EhaD family protein [Methanospirillum sp.]|nr:EhaD family protein [Methanospirillum sp.]
MNDILLFPFCIMAVAGAAYAGFARDPYAKLIGMGIIGGAVMPLIIIRGYMDVAAALAVIIPLSTVFILQIFRKGAP